MKQKSANLEPEVTFLGTPSQTHQPDHAFQHCC